MASTGSERRKTGRLGNHCGGSSAYSSIWDHAATGGHDRLALYSTLPPPSGIYCKKHDVVLNLSDYATSRAVGHVQPYITARDAYIDDEPECMHGHPAGEVKSPHSVGSTPPIGHMALNHDGYFQLPASIMSEGDSDTNTRTHPSNPSGSVDLLTFNPKTTTSHT